MHAIFMPYGKIENVEVFLNDIRAQKYQIPYHSPDGKETQLIWTNSQLRVLPFGFYEHVFPREMMPLVLTTLGFHEEHEKDKTKKLGRAITRYNIRDNGMVFKMIQKALKAKDPPEFKTDKQMLWMMKHVHIIPIGIREDGDITDPDGIHKGWKHEAI